MGKRSRESKLRIEGNLVLGRKTWADTLAERRGGSPELITSPRSFVISGGRGERLVSVFPLHGSFEKTAHSLWNIWGRSFCSSMMIKKKKKKQWGTKFNLLQQTLAIKPSSNSSFSNVNKLGGIPSANTKQASLFSATGFKFLLKDTQNKVHQTAHWYFPTGQEMCQPHQSSQPEDDGLDCQFSPTMSKQPRPSVYRQLNCAAGFPGGTRGKESACQCRRQKRCGSIPG